MSNRIAWFSAGISSFVTAYIGHPDRIIYINIANQHPDSLRFIADAEKLLDKPIEIIGDMQYKQSVDEVIEKRRYVNGPGGGRVHYPAQKACSARVGAQERYARYGLPLGL